MNERDSAMARTKKWKIGCGNGFYLAQSRKVPINRPVLMQKAEEIAKQLGHDQFKSSDGWFNRWKKKHDLRYTELYGEANEADGEVAAMWTSENVQELLKKYEPADVYNADETAFYFRVLSDRVRKFLAFPNYP